jgi:hypothetical protein
MEKLAYSVQVTSHGEPDEPFGWTIRRDADAVAHSSRTFATRAAALADSSRVAITLALADDETQAKKRENARAVETDQAAVHPVR